MKHSNHWEANKIVMKIIYNMLLFLLMMLNCSTYNKIQSSGFLESKFFNKIYHENGNAFYISYTDTHSAIWSYHNGEIDIYKFKNHKLLKKKSLLYTTNKWLADYSKGEMLAMDKCAELDGSRLGFKIKNENRDIEENLPISLDCFIENNFNSGFLEQLSKTIKNFDLVKF